MIKVLVIVGLLIAAFVIGTFVTVWVWGLVVPDVFAGAVEHGILPASLTFVQALKLWLLLLILGLLNTQSGKK